MFARIESQRSTTTQSFVISAVVTLAFLSIVLPADAQPYAYVANLGSDNVSVIDTATNTVVATIVVGDDPDGVAASPDGRRVYVSNFASNEVSVIDTTRQTVTATVDVGRGPVGLVVSNDGDEVLVTNREDDTISVIRTDTNQVTETVPVGDGPDAVAITADGARAYVTNSSSTDPGVVSVINAAYDREIDRINVLRNPNRIVQAPDGTAYVTNFRAWNVSLIDTDDRDVVETFRVDRKPSGIAANPNGAFVYVVGKHGGVTVFDTSRRLVSDWIYVRGRADGIAITRTGTAAYVTNFDDDTVTVIDLTNNAVGATVAVGDQPFAVAVNCVGRGCTDPPYTRIPTPTRTPPPTQTPIPASTPSATLLANVTPVILSVNQVSGRPGDQIGLTVTLHTNGAQVAATQSDLHVSPNLIDPTSVRCRVNPGINKPNSAFAVHDTGSDILLRGLVISFEHIGTIPDGSLLYTCNMRLAAAAPTGRFTIVVDNVGAATPNGEALPTIGTEGRVDVVAGQRSRAVTLQEPALCSGGPDDGAPCADSDCRSGICVLAQGVCDGGNDDGLLCDCPGGRCRTTENGSMCSGGGFDGAACDSDANCDGSTCVAAHQLCQGGVARGMACLRDPHCIDAACGPAPGSCWGGDFDGYGCVTRNDCPRGKCFFLSEPHLPNITPTLSAASRDPRSNDGCAIGTTSADHGWLIALGLAVVLAMPRCVRRGRAPVPRRRDGRRSSYSARM